MYIDEIMLVVAFKAVEPPLPHINPSTYVPQNLPPLPKGWHKYGKTEETNDWIEIKFVGPYTTEKLAKKILNEGLEILKNNNIIRTYLIDYPYAPLYKPSRSRRKPSRTRRRKPSRSRRKPSRSRRKPSRSRRKPSRSRRKPSRTRRKPSRSRRKPSRSRRKPSRSRR